MQAPFNIKQSLFINTVFRSMAKISFNAYLKNHDYKKLCQIYNYLISEEIDTEYKFMKKYLERFRKW